MVVILQTRLKSFNLKCVNGQVPSDDNKEAKPGVSFAPEVAIEEAGGKQESDVKSKIPEGAEATTVLVGTLDELQHSVLAFVRLAKGCNLNITEVSIPVRFLFVLLGPNSEEEAYHEIGRSVATLMSDQVSYGNILLHKLLVSVVFF